MHFSTKIPLEKSKFPIDYASKTILFGSCFAQNMGEKFMYYKFQSLVNPFGILFHPIAIETILKRILDARYYTETDLVFHNELWHSVEVHSQFSNPNKEELLNQLNAAVTTTKHYIENASHAIITFGTAWVYKHLDSGNIVANCHKIPQNNFQKKLLSITEIETSIQNCIDLFQILAPNCNLIFTISPVRHIKDGFVENQQSKAHLVSALHAVLSRNVTKTTYFPAYEILLDELRDYRFYANDLLHPSDLALQYIWDLFINTSLSNASIKVMNEIAAVQKNKSHRSFHPNSEKHQQFLDKTASKIKALQLSLIHI